MPGRQHLFNEAHKEIAMFWQIRTPNLPAKGRQTMVAAKPSKMKGESRAAERQHRINALWMLSLRKEEAGVKQMMAVWWYASFENNYDYLQHNSISHNISNNNNRIIITIIATTSPLCCNNNAVMRTSEKPLQNNFTSINANLQNYYMLDRTVGASTVKPL